MKIKRKYHEYHKYLIFLKTGYICECPPGMSGDAYKTGCNYVDPIRGRTDCVKNQDCASNLICHEGSCISACTNLLCGPNAFCEPENHAGWCRCKVGFVEGQNGECVSREYCTVTNKKLNKTISVNAKINVFKLDCPSVLYYLINCTFGRFNSNVCCIINSINLIDNVSHNTCYSHIHIKNLINTNK